MIVYIITDVDLNTPGAVVSRLLSYSRGLAELGVEVKSCWLSNSEKQSSGTASEYPGLHFWFGQSKDMNSKGVFRILQTTVAAKRLADSIRSDHIAGSRTAVLYYGMLIPERIAIQNVCDKLGIPTFDEITEYPYLARKRRILRKLQYNLFMNTFLPRDKAVLCISGAIQTFLRRHLDHIGAKTKTHLFGIMVEADKFSPDNALPLRESDPRFYLAYCGTMYGDKDGIPDLIRAFALTVKTYPELKLVLVGDNSDRERLEIVNNLINLLSVQDSVIFTGRVDFSTMHRLLCGSEALVLCKPDNKQNEGAFPTKLGEYLACGRPVIATAVGDIPLFLKDGENAFLSPGSDPDSFSTKICECLADSARSKEIANNGRHLAEKVFHYRVKATELKGYLFE